MARPAPAATRAIEVVEFLASHQSESFTLAELSRRTGVNPASLHALMTVLTDAGWVVRHPAHKTFRLGAAVVATGLAALGQHPAITAANEEIRALSARAGGELFVTAVAGREIVFVGRAGDHQASGPMMRPGQRVPLAPPLGLVFMAWSDRGEVDAWLDRADPPLAAAERAAQRTALASVRSRGYAIGLESGPRVELVTAIEALSDEPARAGVREALTAVLAELGHGPYQVTDLRADARYAVNMIAAPVFDATGSVALAITMSGVRRDLSAEEVAALGAEVRGTAVVATKRSLGSFPPGWP